MNKVVVKDYIIASCERKSLQYSLAQIRAGLGSRIIVQLCTFFLSEKSYLLFSGVFGVLVFVGGVVPGVLDVVLHHPVLGGGGRVGAGFFLFIAGSGPTSSGHGCVCITVFTRV